MREYELESAIEQMDLIDMERPNTPIESINAEPDIDRRLTLIGVELTRIEVEVNQLLKTLKN